MGAVVTRHRLAAAAFVHVLDLGREGGAYYLGGQLYQKVAARDGFTLNIVPTAGSVEALRMLEQGQGDVAFIQGGIAAQGDPEKVSALATVGYEPAWIFYRKELAPSTPLDSPLQLKGLRVAIGEPGSGTDQLARLLLEDYGIADENTTLLELPSGEAPLPGSATARSTRRFSVANTVAPILNEYLQEPSLELMSLADANAIARRHRFLSVLDLPKGTLDLVDVRPRQDIKLVLTVANLVMRNDLHPDIVRLLAFAAVELHGPGGFLPGATSFPIPTTQIFRSAKKPRPICCESRTGSSRSIAISRSGSPPCSTVTCSSSYPSC